MANKLSLPIHTRAQVSVHNWASSRSWAKRRSSHFPTTSTSPISAERPPRALHAAYCAFLGATSTKCYTQAKRDPASGPGRVIRRGFPKQKQKPRPKMGTRQRKRRRRWLTPQLVVTSAQKNRHRSRLKWPIPKHTCTACACASRNTQTRTHTFSKTLKPPDFKTQYVWRALRQFLRVYFINMNMKYASLFLFL